MVKFVKSLPAKFDHGKAWRCDFGRMKRLQIMAGIWKKAEI